MSESLPPTECIPEEFTNALKTATAAGNNIFGVPTPVYYTIELTDDESAIHFPASIDPISPKSAKIKIHLSSLIDQYNCDSVVFTDTASGLSLADAAKIHLAASVIPHMLICAVNPRDRDIINKLDTYMSYPDTLTSDVANSLTTLGMFESRIRETILRKSPDQIAEINRYRLALGALGYMENLAGLEQFNSRQQIDFSKRVSAIFVQKLQDMSTEILQWTGVAKKFNLDKHTAEMNFMEEISAFELAAAFPMQLPEISLLAKIVHGK